MMMSRSSRGFVTQYGMSAVVAADFIKKSTSLIDVSGLRSGVHSMMTIKVNYFASVEIEANSRGKFSIQCKLFWGIKWGHFLFGSLIWMSRTLILPIHQHS
jgi:hypothetical protein